MSVDSGGMGMDIHRHDHGWEGLRMLSGTIRHLFPTLLTEARSRHQNQSPPVASTAGLASQLAGEREAQPRGPPSEATIIGRSPRTPGIYMGSGNQKAGHHTRVADLPPQPLTSSILNRKII